MESAQSTGPTPPMTRSWWRRFATWNKHSAAEAESFEKRLFELVDAPVTIANTPVGEGKDQYMRSYHAGSADSPATIVCLPGYAAGAGFYFRNLADLSRYFSAYLVDFLGTGMSGRPKFAARNTEQADAFFIDSLEAWREANSVERMILVGHSLGGYLSAKYALRHPERVQHLVLVCPAGVAQPPEREERDAKLKQIHPLSPRRMMFNTFLWGWNTGVTPGAVVRTLGPLGESMTHNYAQNRLKLGAAGTLSPEASDIFKGYFYQIMSAKGSGEFGLKHLLAPGAYAHTALEHELRDIKVPVSFIYGSEDWMDPNAALRVSDAIKTAHAGPRCEGDALVLNIDGAGHFPYIDEPQKFLDCLLACTRSHVGDTPLPASVATAEHMKPRVPSTTPSGMTKR